MNNVGVPQSVVQWLFEVTQQIYGRHDPKTTFNEVLLCISQFRQLRLRTRNYSYFDNNNNDDANGCSDRGDSSMTASNAPLILNIHGRLSKEEIPILVWVPLEFPRVPPKLSIDMELCRDKSLKLKLSPYVDSQGNVNIPSWSLRQGQSTGQYSITYGIQEFIQLVDLGYIGFIKERESTSTSVPTSTSNKPPLPDKPPLPPKPPGKHVSTSPTQPAQPLSTSQTQLTTASPIAPISKPIQAPVPPAIPERTYKHGPKIPTRAKQQQQEPKTKSTAPPSIPDFVDSVATAPNGEPTSKLRQQILRDFAQLVNELRVTETHKVETEVTQRKRAIEDAISQFKERLNYQKQAAQYMHDNVELVKTRLQDEMKMITDFKNSRLDSLGNPDPDDIAICDVKAIEQMYDLVSRDSALTDAIKLCYDLLNKGLVELELYIKETRRLAREQFLVRVHIRKIASYLQ